MSSIKLITWKMFFMLRMKKFFFIIGVYFFVILSAYSQTELLFGLGGGKFRFDKIKKNTFDTAQVCAYYKVAFLNDSTKRNDYTKGLCLLSFSDRYVRFGDYYAVLADSINDLCAKNKKNAYDEELDDAHTLAISKKVFYITTMTDLENLQTTVQLRRMREYQYTMPTPDMHWILESGDTLISGVSCKKATCNYAGRHYIAWYDENFPVPYGPYIFYGLPGLIMKIYDDKRNWIFENVGIEKAEKMKDMYLYKNKKIIKTSREHALAAYKNETENMLLAAIESGRIKFIKKGSRFNDMMKRRPSNMIEQEW